MKIHSAALLVALAASACGGNAPSSPSGPSDNPGPQPANVTIVSAEEGLGHGFGLERITLHLHNTGGPGTYTVEAWGLPHTPNGEDSYFGRTEAVDVAAGYDETASWEFTTSAPPDFHYINWVLVFTRDQGSAQYRQTDRHDFPY